MLLAVDIGNTSTKCGIYDGEDLLDRFSVPTSDLERTAIIRDQLGPAITEAVICSVVPGASDAWENFLKQKQIGLLRVTNDLDLGLAVHYEPISALGTDRLVNAFAAIEKFGSPAIVCSFGTATTIDAVDKERGFLGGIIAPGIEISARALKTNTSQLPDIAIKKPDRLIGHSTEDAILSGVVFGHTAMVEGLIERFAGEIGSRPIVVATGGFASLLADTTARFDHVDENLTLDGLRIVHGRIVG